METIEKVKQMLTDGVITKEQVAKYFPELKDSEDEKIRKWLIEMVEEVRKANPTNESHNGNCSDAIAWLEKQGEQKPACSEEDIRKIELICTYLNAYKAYQTPVGIEYIDGCISWIKALIERVDGEANCTTMWKPSDEQMNILFKYAEQNNKDGSILTSLYQQLKKLKEVKL